MTMPNLSKVADRAKLKPRPHVYWQKLSRGCYLGFRKTTATSDGTWLARAYDEATGERPQKSIGDFSRHPHHARFDMAKAEAEIWFAHLGKGGETEAATVRKACERYVAHLSKEGRSKAADDAKARFARYVYSDTKFASIQLDKLKPTHVDEWRKALRQTPTRGGARKGQSRSDSALSRIDGHRVRVIAIRADRVGVRAGGSGLQRPGVVDVVAVNDGPSRRVVRTLGKVVDVRAVRAGHATVTVAAGGR
jgi:hypothetical protein